MKIKLVTTDSQFDGLHEALNTVRRTSSTVKVDKESLRNLLMDHAELQDALSRRSVHEDVSVEIPGASTHRADLFGESHAA